MAKTLTRSIHNLSARIDAHLNQFADDADGDEGYAPSRPEMKKRNPMLRAAGAGAAVAGGVAIGSNKDKIKAGYDTAKAGLGARVDAMKPGYNAAKKKGKKAVFKGMQGAADVAEKGMRQANKIGLPKVGEALGSVAKKVSKKSMAFFDADIAETLIRLESKVRRFEQRI